VDAHDYDAIFSAIRSFAGALVESQKWLDRAEETRERAWRLSFLQQARQAYDSAKPHLGELHRRIGSIEGLEPTDTPMEELAPHDALRQNLLRMQTNYDAHEHRLSALEMAMAPGAPQA
jgi:hypothetical protein